MFRRRGENLHAIFILLFLNVAFFFLEHQDEPRFGALFSFDKAAFLHGQYWRLLTYQFAQAGQGWSFVPKPVFLFFTLLILYFMGAALEEEWGTVHFVAFFILSTIATAVVAGALGVPVIGSFFVRYTLLFAYASIFPEQTFYLFAIIPIRVRWLAYATAAILAYSAVAGGPANLAAAAGALVGYVYCLLLRSPATVAPVRPPVETGGRREGEPDFSAVRNAARFVAIKKALASGADGEIDRLVAQCERDIVAGVNICPPADYKPEGTDGYCLRCEGFQECSARYIRLNRTRAATPAAVPEVSS